MEPRWDPGLPLADVSPGKWLQERLWTWRPRSGQQGVAVGCLVPQGFDAYARVLHPAQYETETGLELTRWSAVASWTGTVAHPLMQFHRIAKLSPPAFPNKSMPPYEGALPAAECERLVAILRVFTSTPDRCYFGVWDGFGVPELNAFTGRPRLMLTHRAYFLFPGPIGAVSSLRFGNFEQPPNLWWPADRAWCVATDIDLTETYIGGGQACINRVIADPDLEAFQVSLEARVDVDGDVINQ